MLNSNMGINITQKEKELLNYYNFTQKANRPWSAREAIRILDIKSISTLNHMIKRLNKKGFAINPPKSNNETVNTSKSKGITQREANFIRYYELRMQQKKGWSYRDAAKFLGYASHNSVTKIVLKLRRKGYSFPKYKEK